MTGNHICAIFIKMPMISNATFHKVCNELFVQIKNFLQSLQNS